MKEDSEIIYNHFRIYLNTWGEYCVCRKLTGKMVSYNSGFNSLKTAKKFIDKINPLELDPKEIEGIAKKMKVLTPPKDR